MKWYERTGDAKDVVISTRVRFARNLASYNFENYRGIHILGARIEDSFDE